MRLITWNCKGAFHRKHEAVSALCPDILIVPECEKLSKPPQAFGSTPVHTFSWFGDDPRKGLAIVSYGGYSLQVHPSYDSRHRWIVPLTVSGPHSFLLFAVWTLPHATSKSYVHLLLEAFEQYTPLIGTSEVIWAGDFNAGFAFDRPSHHHKFRDFVGILGRHGLRSLYHEHQACAHGEEPEHTYFHRHKADEPFHIDYVFASGGFTPGSFNVSVGSHAEWTKLSDHMPLVCDFYESASVELQRDGADHR